MPKSEATPTTAVALRDGGSVPARVDALVSWVQSASVEDVCWRISEIGSLREWVLVQKEASDLRVRAVRLELIALRKVALGGLAKKIAGAAQLRSAALWLSRLTDEEFANVLAELDGDRTPIALYRADREQRDALARRMNTSETEPSDWQNRTTWDANSDRRAIDSDHFLRRAATDLLADLVQEGEPFTIAEAAETLASRLRLDVVTAEQTAEGLREMVRSAIRKGEKSEAIDAWSELPVAFTVQRSDSTYVRVPATKASVGHLIAHVHEVDARARAAVLHADLLKDLAKRACEYVGVSYDEVKYLGDESDGPMATSLTEVIDAIRIGSVSRRAAA